MVLDSSLPIDAPQAVSAIKNYYGAVLQSSGDLKTSACSAADAPPPHVRRALARVHDEVQARFYGCGSPIPAALDGITVLDLGCGSGRDCYVLSQLVGPHGKVIGVDMTEEQLAVAREHQKWHADVFGYANVEFRHGAMEDLAALDIADESVDLVVSNCVLNLSMDKPRVFKEVFRVLKPGGELYFSDVFSNCRIPAALLKDPVLHGECLAGAFYVEDFRRLMLSVGCQDFRILSSTRIGIEDPEIEEKIGFAEFTSCTVRAFKLPFEDRCEDYGQVVSYRGGMSEHPHFFTLDNHHRFQRGKRVPICGNTADMLSATRYAPYFTLIGDKTTHYGLFDCVQTDQLPAPDAIAGCC
jgi:arsenite methyltransferase